MRAPSRISCTALVLAVCAGVLNAPPAEADSRDDIFMAALDDVGFPHVNRSTITSLGRAICEQLHDGVGFTSVAKLALESGFTAAQGGQLIGAAVGAYCPDEQAAMKNWVAAGEPG